MKPKEILHKINDYDFDWEWGRVFNKHLTQRFTEDIFNHNI